MGVDHAEIYNNTIYQSPVVNGPNTYYPPAIFVEGHWINGGSDLHFRNNIFYTAGNPFVRVDSGTVSNGLLFQGNDYYSTGAFTIYYNGATISSLLDWQANPGPNQERLDGAPVGRNLNPQFMNAGGGGTVGNADLLGLPTTLTAYQFTPSTPDDVKTKAINLWFKFGIDPGPKDFWGDTLPPLNMNSVYSMGAFQQTS